MKYKVLNFNNEVLGDNLSFDAAEELCTFNDDTTSSQFVVDSKGDTIISNINGHVSYREPFEP